MGKEMSKLRMSRQNYARDWPYDKMLSKVSHALNAAARYNKLAALRVLLNYTDRYILTLTGDCEALLIAIIEGHEEAALTMISHGKLLKEPKARGKAMALAAIYGRSSIVKALLQQKVYLDLQSQAGRAAFTFAHERGCQEIIQLLLTAEAATVSAWPGDTSPTKSTLWLLHSATCYGCVDVLAKLIPRRVSSTYKVYLEELLFLAATNNQPGPVNFLLQWGMSVDYRGHRGRTMLSHAMEHSAEKSAQALISAGCDLFALDDDLKTPLHYAPNDKMVRLINSAREKSL
ncbi:ankyrin repeat-containing domain protein, partial [Aspergillus varians]